MKLIRQRLKNCWTLLAGRLDEYRLDIIATVAACTFILFRPIELRTRAFRLVHRRLIALPRRYSRTRTADDCV